MHNMLMCNIISKVLHFQNLWWYSTSTYIFICIIFAEYYLKYNILYATRLYIAPTRISISTLSKYIWVKKNKKTYVYRATLAWRHICTGTRLHPVQMCGIVSGIPPGTNDNPHLYQMVYTDSIPDTNEGYESVQITVFPVVNLLAGDYITRHGPTAYRSSQRRLEK
jgi:hypothetical protein